MNVTNNQVINKELLKTLIGRKIKAIYHDEFVFVSTTYGIAYINIDDKYYSLTDFYEIKNVLGDDEEISVLKFANYEGEIKSLMKDQKIICENINNIITNIILVNTKTHIINKNDNLNEYTLLDTHGIIFNLSNNYQIAFEKDDFGENISIYRGYDLKEKFKGIPQDIISTIIDEYEATCEIDYVSI